MRAEPFNESFRFAGGRTYRMRMDIDPKEPNPYAAPKMDHAYPGAAAAPLPDAPKQRGGCLTALLVLMMIANPLVGLMYIVSGDAIQRALHAPAWAIPVLGGASMLNFVWAVGVWKFKRWGVYGFLAMAAVALIVNFTIGVAPMQAVLGLIGPAILIALVRPLWSRFD